MDTSRVTTGDKIVGTAGILLLLDLLALPWHQVFSFRITAVQAPGGWWGTLAALLTLVILVVTFLRRIAAVPMPTLPRPIGEVNLAANALVVALLLVKLALNTDFLGFGAFVALVLAGTMVAGALLGKDDTDEPPPVGSSGGAPPTPF